MDYRERISVDPGVMLGKPVIRGTRITIELIMHKMAEGMTADDLREAYPNLSVDDVRAALSYCADVISHEELLAS
jgi:uncharacterized protein (DUF433 family)